MRRSRPLRSTARSTEARRRRPGVDVYLFPAVVGGGLGDIEEVLAAGRVLRRAAFPVYFWRAAGQPLPRSVEGPWAWPTLRRVPQPVLRHRAALTVSPSWGVSAAPDRPGPLGRGGAWAEESARVEAEYGSDRTVHVSLEEFARTATSLRETRERLREGGVRARALGRRLAEARAAREVEVFRAAFRRFRAFDRPNVLHVFASFRRDPGFTREFPPAVQTGPLWPRRYRRTFPAVGRASHREWVWYASPASAEEIAPAVADELAAAKPSVHLFVRSPRPWVSLAHRRGVSVETRPLSPRAWRRRFRRAEVRIVTGSRSLLEALELGGPFLYFNGVLGRGGARRRHRPEKLLGLLALGAASGLAPDVRRDLADFSRGRRVAEVVGRVVRRQGGWRRGPSPVRPRGFAPPYDDAGRLLVTVARALARPDGAARAVVRRARDGWHL